MPTLKPSANKICSETWARQAQLSHHQRLAKTKSHLDTSAPPVYAHLIHRSKKEQMLEERYTQIEHENRLLLKKMSKIMRTSSQEKFQTVPKKSSLNSGIRKRDLKKIMDENQAILKRIQNRKPVYKRGDFERHAMTHMTYRNNIREKSVRLLPTLIPDPSRAKSAPERREQSNAPKLDPIKKKKKQPLQRPKAQKTTTAKTKPAANKKKGGKNRLTKGGYKINGLYHIVTVDIDGDKLKFVANNMDEGDTRSCLVAISLINELTNNAKLDNDCADQLVGRLKLDGAKLVFDDSPDWKPSAEDSAPAPAAEEPKAESKPAASPEPSAETQLSMILKVNRPGSAKAVALQVFAGDKFVFKTEALEAFKEGDNTFDETCNLQTKDKQQALQLRLCSGDEVLGTGDFTLGSLTEGTPSSITLSDDKFTVVLETSADKATVSIDLDEEDGYGSAEFA